MLRRDFMQLGVLTIAGGCLGGCRGNQYAKVMHPGEPIISNKPAWLNRPWPC